MTYTTKTGCAKPLDFDGLAAGLAAWRCGGAQVQVAARGNDTTDLRWTPSR